MTSARGGGLPARRDYVIVAVLTLIVLIGSTFREVWDEPLGQDANRYLKNALAVAQGDWSHYHAWRGPLHAGLTAALGGVVGLIPASKALSVLSTAALVPLTWLLGRRTVGEREALCGVALLALWPDLWWLARFSTPYPLLTLLVVAGIAAASRGAGVPAGSSRGAGVPAGPSRGAGVLAGPSRGAGVLAGLCFALAVATDLRAQVLGGVVALVALYRRDFFTAGALLIGIVVARAGLTLLPTPLEPLSEQIAVHSRLLAQGDPACHDMAGRLPTAADLFGECARMLLADNLSRALRASVALPALVALAAAGLRGPRGAGVPAGPLVLAAPALTLLPALALTLTYHRYLQPMAPLLLLLVGAGLVRVLGRWAPAGVGLLAILAFLSPGSLWARATAPPSAEHAMAVPLGVARPLTVAARVVEAGAGPSDRIADCATADLEVRLYPRPVDAIGMARKVSARCAKLLAEGPDDRPTWVLARREPSDPLWAGWSVELREVDPDGRELVVLRGGAEARPSR